MKKAVSLLLALLLTLSVFSGCADQDAEAEAKAQISALSAEISGLKTQLSDIAAACGELSEQNAALSLQADALAAESRGLSLRDAELSEQLADSSCEKLLVRTDPAPVFIENSMTTRSDGFEYIIPEKNTCSVIFNVVPNADYTVTVEGAHDRFRLYGKKLAASTLSFKTEVRVDGVIADKDTDESIDTWDTITFHSGEYRTVILYLSAKQYLEGKLTVSVTQLNNFAYSLSEEYYDAPKAPTFTDIFVPWVPEKVTHGTEWADMTSDQFIEAAYEPLRQQYPTYISREIIGRDQSWKYNIYAYTFEPDYYEQTIYLQSGVHPYEIDGWMGLALLMEQICNNWESNDALAYLRWGCKIVVVPVVNVWGVSQPRDKRTLKNSAGVNINRDTESKIQREVQVVTEFLDALAPELSFALDFHTTVNNSYGDYYVTAFTGAADEFITKRTAMMLARKNAHERMPEYLAKYGLKMDELRLPYFSDSKYDGTFSTYFRDLGVPGGTVEHSDYVWDNALATYTTLTRALEAFGNQTIQHAINKLYLKK